MVSRSLGPVVLDIQGLELAPEEKPLLCHPMVGGVILFSRNYRDPAQLRNLVDAIREVRPELVLAVDQEGGRVQRLRLGFTRIPPMQRLGGVYHTSAEAGRQLARDCGWLLASEVLSSGIDISFAPVLDVDDHKSSIIGDRAFSPDPMVVTEVASAFMEGMHEAGMATTGKHFPGHGSVQADSHLELPVDNRSLAELEQHDLVPFRQLLGQLDGIMPAHMLFPQIDSDLVGFSPWWLQHLLRGEYGFDGVIFSDDLSMAGAAAGGSYLERADKALNAGCDAVLVCNSPDNAKAVVEHLERQGASLSDRLSRMKARGTPLEWSDLQATDRYQNVRQALENLLTNNRSI